MGDELASHQRLTPHELQVARLVVSGASNRDLAATLFISPRTVEAHLTAIFRKWASATAGRWRPGRWTIRARALSDRFRQGIRRTEDESPDQESRSVRAVGQAGEIPGSSPERSLSSRCGRLTRGRRAAAEQGEHGR